MMPLLRHCAALLLALYLPHALAEVQVKGWAPTGSAPGKLYIPSEQIMAWPSQHSSKNLLSAQRRLHAAITYVAGTLQ